MELIVDVGIYSCGDEADFGEGVGHWVNSCVQHKQGVTYSRYITSFSTGEQQEFTMSKGSKFYFLLFTSAYMLISPNSAKATRESTEAT